MPHIKLMHDSQTGHYDLFTQFTKTAIEATAEEVAVGYVIFVEESHMYLVTSIYLQDSQLQCQWSVML